MEDLMSRKIIIFGENIINVKGNFVQLNLEGWKIINFKDFRNNKKLLKNNDILIKIYNN